MIERPNIVYIHSHDTGRYIQPYGHAVGAPSLQRLADRGVLFRRAFCAGPTCSPSRASLLTGQCPHSSGMLGGAHYGFALKDYTQHILHTLREIGYHSTLAGMQHIAKVPQIIGYDQLLVTHDKKKALVENVVPSAIEFLTDRPKRPFFLSVGFFETHRPFHPPTDSEDDRYCLPPLPLPDTPQTRQDMAGFKASVREVDRGVGELLDALDANRLADNTLVIYTTDHGIAFPEMKCNLTDHGIGVSLIIRGPGGFTGGKVCDAMVSHIDVFPTLCDLLGISRPPWLQGKSMMPLIRGQADRINEAIFAEVNHHVRHQPQRAVRTERWKYIRRFDQHPRPAPDNCDDGPSKDLWMEHGWHDQSLPREALHDLIFDPNETRNLAGEPTTKAVLKEMRSRLDRWMRETDDPLQLKGTETVSDTNGTS